MSTTTLLPILFLLVHVGLLAGIWVGVIALWRGQRGADWCLMAIGAALLTIGPIAYSVTMWGAFEELGRFSSSPTPGMPSLGPWVFLGIAAAIVIPTGFFLFSVGFAIHGLKVARVRERNGELEAVSAAMTEEIDRLRQTGPMA